MHGTALMTTQGSSSCLGPLHPIHMGGLFSKWLLWLGQLVSPVFHLVYFKGVMIFLESELPLCLDDFIVALPYSMVTITNLFHLGLWPEATLSNAARGLHFLPTLLAGGTDSCLLGVWTCEAVPSYWLGTRVSSTFLWVIAWIWLIATLVGIIPTHLYHRVSIMICGAPQGLCSQSVTRVGCRLDWTGGRLMSSGFSCLRLWVAAGWMGRVLYPLLVLPSSVPALGLLLLWPSDVLPGEWSHFLCLKPRPSRNRWLTGVLTARYPVLGELEMECWPSMLGCSWMPGSGALKFWSGVIHWVVHPWMHYGGESFTHWACGTSTWLCHSGEKPWKKPHKISLTHLGKDLPECGVHLLNHPGPLVLLFLNHPELLVFIILGQLFQLKGQLQFKLSLDLGGFL